MSEATHNRLISKLWQEIPTSSLLLSMGAFFKSVEHEELNENDLGPAFKKLLHQWLNIAERDKLGIKRTDPLPPLFAALGNFLSVVADTLDKEMQKDPNIDLSPELLGMLRTWLKALPEEELEDMYQRMSANRDSFVRVDH